MESLSVKTARKVPEITLIFWVIKLLTTAMGEATSDFLVFKFNPYLAVAVGFMAFAISLAIQFRAKKYQPLAYWFAVSMVAVFGTMAADGLHIQLHVPYIASSLFYALALAVIFFAWHMSEKTLSIHSITSRRREVFYWLAVLATFALGTAVGDLTASTFGLGYFASGVMFSVLFLVPAVAYRLGANSILCFWTAYVLTRPLGASFADWTSKPAAIGGLNYGDGQVALVLAVVIAILVGWLEVSAHSKSVRKRLG